MNNPTILPDPARPHDRRVVKAIAVAVALATAAAIAFDRFNRRLEAACALPEPRRHPSIPGSLTTPKQPEFRRIPLALELVYVAIGVSASVGRTIRKALA